MSADPPGIPGPGGRPAGAFVVTAQAPPPTRWWLHGLLLALTLLTTTFWGAALFAPAPEGGAAPSLREALLDPAFWLAGLSFSVPLLTIFLCHESGHYLMARRHGLDVTPPYFLPAPVPIGTFGAVIRIRSAMRSKAQLLDVGVAGPIAGFVALLPFLVAGLALSESGPLPDGPGVIFFGEPLGFRLATVAMGAAPAPGEALTLHPVGYAAWFGMLLTALNLLPFAQLDGGHVTYAMFGRWHRRLAVPLLGVLVALGFLWWPWWIWTGIVLMLRVRHPRMWDETQRLDRRRLALGWLAIALFVLCFHPVPVAPGG